MIYVIGLCFLIYFARKVMFSRIEFNNQIQFEKIKRETKMLWEKELKKIEVEGKSQEKKEIF